MKIDAQKAADFLWIVQTVIISNNIRLATDDPGSDRDAIKLAMYSATGTFIYCDEAVRASKLIPASMSASSAAHDFVTFMLPNLSKQEEKALGKPLQVPHWFAR